MGNPSGYAPSLELPPPFGGRGDVLRAIEDMARQLDQARLHCDDAKTAGEARAWERRLLVRHGAMLGALSIALRAQLVDPIAYEQLRRRAMDAIGAKSVPGPTLIVGAR